MALEQTIAWLESVGWTPVYILLVLIFTPIVAKIVDVFMARSFREISAKRKKPVDETRHRMVRNIVRAVIYVLGLLVVISFIPELKNLSLALFAGAGFAGIVIGLAAQNAFSNILSGIFLTIFQPFRLGDRVKINEEYGSIEDITLRHTVMKTWDNRRLVIPNAQVNESSIVNYSLNDEKILMHFEMGISYDSDIDRAKKIMLDEAMKHPDLLDVNENAEFLEKKDVAKVRVVGTGDFSVNLRLYAWARDQPTAVKMKFDLIESIKKRFDKEGIEIPFPYRTIVYKKDLERNQKKKR
ncbi:MAG: mechanosensitive ion channel [Candidatus Aenigmarchaeota archaeon]|nr:mechanosensitive ion channel [Candidatus Aenigmarchaeota archaeon]NIP40538.1 mechanosensitive ion channel [Candidatus Aenigmarchaeota archaeon]NIQ18383.1 mechanosensitive ion channel [Candidatus Aenigmarchaeota archaeon]